MVRSTEGGGAIPPSYLRLNIYYRLLFPLVIGLIVTLSVTLFIRQQEDAISRLDFQQHAADAAREVNHLFTNSINVTVYLSALYNSSDDVSREEFELFAKNLIEVHPVIQALEWVPRVEGSHLVEFEKSNKLATPGFTVTERDENSQIVPVSKRAVYFPVQYVYPIKGNEQAIGYDIASNKARKKMLVDAYKGDTLTASSRVKLVQENGDSYGILVTMPVYIETHNEGALFTNGKNLQGYVLGVYRINEILEQSLLQKAYVPSSFRLIDNSSSAEERVLYKRELAGVDQSAWFNYVEAINVAGRDYSIHISEKPEYFVAQFRASTMALFAGLIITLLTTIYISLIRKRNTELYQSNYDLSHVMDEMKTLKGTIPICSYCHNIRDDAGAWEQLESYLSKYSEASFSHGICPECLPKARADVGLDKE